MLLEDLLSAENFAEAVENLARDFRKKYSLLKVHQLGLVVPEVEATALELEEKGIGPFFIVQGSPVLWCERGELKDFKGKMGLAYFQGVELELLEPGLGSDFYRESLDPEGRIAVQHLGFLTREVEESARKLEQEGFPVQVRGKLKAGPLSIDFAYLDSFAQCGFIMEFISWRLFGIPFSPRAGLVHSLARLEKWSGKRSLSV